MMRQRITSVGLALLLLVSVVTTPAAAVSSTPTTTPDDGCGYIEYTSFTGGAFSCAGEYTNASAAEMQDHLEVYQHGVGVKSALRPGMVIFNNSMNEMETAARMQMQVAVARAYENGSTQAEAKVAARQAITEYYQIRESNILETWETRVANVDAIRDNVAADGDNYRALKLVPPANTPGALDSQTAVSGNLTTNHATTNYTLLNGTTREVRAFQGQLESAGGDTTYYWTDNITIGPSYHGESVSVQWESYDGNYEQGEVQVNAVRLVPPNPSNQELVTMARFYTSTSSYADKLDRLHQEHQDMLNYTDQFVEQTYSEFESGEIQSDDLISRLTQLEGFSQDAVGENATMNDIVVALSSMGLDRPNTSTGYMSTEFVPEKNTDGTAVSHNGMLLSGSAPAATNGTWKANYTYSPAELDGVEPVMFASEDGTTYSINTSHSLTLNEIVGTDGQHVDATETDGIPDEDDYQTANTQEYRDLLNQTAELYAALEEEKTSGGGGGSSSDGNNWFQWDGLGSLAVGASAGLIAALLALAAGAIGFVLVSRQP